MVVVVKGIFPSDGDVSKFDRVDCLVFRVKGNDSKRRTVKSA